MNLSSKVVIFQIILNLFLSISLTLLICMFMDLHMIGISTIIGLCLFNAVFHLFAYMATLIKGTKNE